MAGGGGVACLLDGDLAIVDVRREPASPEVTVGFARMFVFICDAV